MSKPKIYMTMLGAAGDEVTGSSTLLKIVYDKRTSYGLIDAGIVQGKSEIRNFSYPVLAENLDFVILTHAHADHFLALPLLIPSRNKPSISTIFFLLLCNFINHYNIFAFLINSSNTSFFSGKASNFIISSFTGCLNSSLYAQSAICFPIESLPYF